VFFINYENEPAAVCVIFPDINPLLNASTAGSAAGLLKRSSIAEIKGLRLLMFGSRRSIDNWGFHVGLPPHL